jgi:uncharacterized phage infection (PIP) family protein YhgE
MVGTNGQIEDLVSEQNPDLKDQIKKIEDGILEQIRKYNREVKLAEEEEKKLRQLQDRAYRVSSKFRKATRVKGPVDLGALEAELNELDTEVQGALSEVLDSKSTALLSLQKLYNEHIDYLSKVANGLKQRCDELQGSSVYSAERGVRPDNVNIEE